jgi:hypothetical protein
MAAWTCNCFQMALPVGVCEADLPILQGLPFSQLSHNGCLLAVPGLQLGQACLEISRLLLQGSFCFSNSAQHLL